MLQNILRQLSVFVSREPSVRIEGVQITTFQNMRFMKSLDLLPLRRFVSLSFHFFWVTFTRPSISATFSSREPKKVFPMRATVLSLTNDKVFSYKCSALGKAVFLVPLCSPVFFDGVEIATFFWTVDISTAPFSASGLWRSALGRDWVRCMFLCIVHQYTPAHRAHNCVCWFSYLDSCA